MVTIYLIENVANGTVYVGSTVNSSSRLTKHRYMLKKGNHRNRLLQADYDNYGLDQFKFTSIEEVNSKVRYEREQFWMDRYRETNNLYNIFPIAGKSSGRIHFDETKRKMSRASKGRRPSEKTLLASANARRGKPMPEETRKKLSEAHKKRDNRGSRSTNAKLTETKVEDILARILKGELQEDIAKAYGVSVSAIAGINQGLTWTHVPGVRSSSPRTKLTDDDIVQILLRFRKGETGTVIAKDYGINHCTAYQIKNRKSWTHVTLPDRIEPEVAI
ncbi:GIY-YIG nuclease family protein [Paenibacillus agricola]|uniref:GIY-YIG nuclease family protein n=1 Tax=Paenibacillus agricola TaxID=2716264 RepID=A0ABX0J6C6_9BACL|nr:GIY-YIG nuclease family protein [Paenibacillus agricola]NHN31173.1 GIY-YIG nuclease family protein [Paenibacillus agricola]